MSIKTAHYQTRGLKSRLRSDHSVRVETRKLSTEPSEDHLNHWNRKAGKPGNRFELSSHALVLIALPLLGLTQFAVHMSRHVQMRSTLYVTADEAARDDAYALKQSGSGADAWVKSVYAPSSGAARKSKAPRRD